MSSAPSQMALSDSTSPSDILSPTMSRASSYVAPSDSSSTPHVTVSVVDPSNMEMPSPSEQLALMSVAQNGFAKRFRQLNDELANCGIGDYIDTPTIAIIGSQSAGKSSVLEALSGIAFPRSAGTCTRTPTQVRLFNAPNEQWKCSVSLRFQVDAQGNALNQVNTIAFGEPLTDKKEVQARISAAQRAILNPSKDPVSFLPHLTSLSGDKAGAKNEIGFSENTICLEVRGADLVDLSLIDLPGLIANAGEEEDEASIELIKNLVIKTIDKPNCLVLSTIPMVDDFANHLSVKLAKEADRLGKRTLGVLTKPDRMQKGDLSQWKPIIEDQKERLIHGYFIVKNLSTEELQNDGYDHAKARALEKAFFAGEPWRSLSIQAKQRMGSANLAKRLERLLYMLIQEKLPHTIDEVRRLSAENDQQISDLPDPVLPDSAIHKLNELCHQLGRTIQSTLTGDKDPIMFALPQKVLFGYFRQRISSTRPQVLPFTDEEMAKLEERKLTGFESDCGLLDELNVEDMDRTKGMSSTDKDKIMNLLSSSRIKDAKSWRLILSLTIVQQKISTSVVERLPGNVPWHVKEGLMRKAIGNMEPPVWALFTDIVDHLKRVVSRAAVAHFGCFSGSQICKQVTNILTEMIDRRAGECKNLLESVIEAEKELIYSYNHHYYTDKKRAIVDLLSAKRIKFGFHGGNVAFPYDEATGTKIVDYLKNQGVMINQLSDLSKNRVPTYLTEQIEICAEVRAYWQLVYKRFVDYVRAFITVHLVKAVGNSSFEVLCEHLGLNGKLTAAEAMAWLRESDDMRSHRDELQLQKARLDKALEAIDSFQRG